MRSKLSAIAARSPCRNGPLAAQSRLEPVPYSLPARTMVGTPFGEVALGGLVDRHLLVRRQVAGEAPLDPGDQLVADADVGEGAAHHDLVVAAAGAVAVPLGPLYAAALEVGGPPGFPGRSTPPGRCGLWSPNPPAWPAPAPRKSAGSGPARGSGPRRRSACGCRCCRPARRTSPPPARRFRSRPRSPGRRWRTPPRTSSAAPSAPARRGSPPGRARGRAGRPGRPPPLRAARSRSRCRRGRPGRRRRRAGGRRGSWRASAGARGPRSCGCR